MKAASLRAKIFSVLCCKLPDPPPTFRLFVRLLVRAPAPLPPSHFWRPIARDPLRATPEAEYLAASDAAKEGRSLLKLANNILNKEIKTIGISADNRAAELWTRQPCQPSQTKQIDIRYHHIRDEVAKGRTKIIPVPSCLNLADPLPKGLRRDQHGFLNEVIFGYKSPS